MEKKKGMKISLSTFFLILAIVVIAVIGIFLLKIYNEKIEETNKSSDLQMQVNSLNGKISDLQGKIHNISDTINSNNLTETENGNKPDSETSLDIDKIILDELKERRFLAKNNINLDSKVRYIAINNTGNPIYIVHVQHSPNDEGNRSIYFFVTYQDEKVFFSKALEHKYEYDLFYESKSMTIKAELTYREIIRTIYGTIKDGEYVQLDVFVEPASEETQNYLLNDKEVSKMTFENAKEKYSNKQYISFSEMAKELK